MTTECQRCGQCCLQGGPGLHEQDLDLITGGLIQKESLLVLRRGEPAWDQPANAFVLLETEMLKIASRPGQRSCVFYDGAGCAVYACRPVQCRTLFCKDSSGLKTLYRTPCLTRADVLDKASALWELVCEHDARCGFSELTDPALEYRRTRSAAAADSLLRALRYDDALRESLSGLGPALEFAFGRPLRTTLGAFGLAITDGPCAPDITIRPLPAQMAELLHEIRYER